MKLTIKNQQGQPVMFNITDRPTEVKTSSIGSPPNCIPPMSALSFTIQKGEIIVFAHDGSIVVLKEEFNG